MFSIMFSCNIAQTYTAKTGVNSMTKAILILNGPNLNMLGAREPSIYGNHTLDDIEKACEKKAKTLGFEAVCRQSNSESEIVSWIQETNAKAIVINAAAYTHTSVAIRDALLSRKLPFIEVHLSNVYAREEFRHHSFLSDVAFGVVSGLGVEGYKAAIEVVSQHIK